MGTEVGNAGQAGEGVCMEFVGVVLAQAQVRTKLDRHGMAMPVLCVQVGQVGPGHHTLHVERCYTELQRDAVIALACALKKGTRVRVRTSLQHLQLHLPHAQSVDPVTPTHH